MKQLKFLRVFALSILLFITLVALGWNAKNSSASTLLQSGIVYVNGVFASGNGSSPLTSTHYQMQVVVGEVGLPGIETVLTSSHFQLQPGFLASVPINDPNSAPTDITLSNNSVSENQPVGTIVGRFTTTDPDTGDTHTYSLACITPGLDDASFAITGAALNTAAVFDYETKNSYNICVRTTDSGGLFFDKNFVVTILNVIEKITVAISSGKLEDGYILESSETSNLGGTMNSTATTLRLGDDAARRQYRSILSFKTSSLPDNAIITEVTLKVKRQTIVGGGNPVAMFQGLIVDVKKGFFGTTALQTADFQTAANKTYGPFTPSLSGGWYTLNLTSAKAYINKLATGGGLTQIRLRFKLDDNNNALANYLSLYSGNAAVASRPQLIIEYYVP